MLLGSFGFRQTLLDEYCSLNKKISAILRKCQNNTPRFDRAKRVEKSPRPTMDELYSYIRETFIKSSPDSKIIKTPIPYWLYIGSQRLLHYGRSEGWCFVLFPKVLNYFFITTI